MWRSASEKMWQREWGSVIVWSRSRMVIGDRCWGECNEVTALVICEEEARACLRRFLAREDSSAVNWSVREEMFAVSRERWSRMAAR